MPPTVPLRRRVATPALALLLGLGLLAGCGDDDASADDKRPAAGASDAFPVDVLSGPVDGDDEITVDEQPTSIVSLSPTATEMLWAIGADDQVVAVDDQSDFPEDVPTTKLSGYQPNVEAILAYEPDLVVASADAGDLVAGMEAVKVPVLILPSATDLDEAYSQIERLGTATGHAEEAEDLVDGMQSDIDQALAGVPDDEGLTYFHELGPDLYTVTSKTFIGAIYRLFGLESIADSAGGADDYPQLSSEYVVSADPDLIFVADNDCCGVTPEQVGARPGWKDMSAVQGGDVHLVSEDITSRWGPRIVDFVESVSQILSEHEHAG